MVGKDVKERDVFVLVSIMFNHILLAPVVTAVLNTVPKHSLLAKCQGATVRPTMIQVHVMFVAMTGWVIVQSYVSPSRQSHGASAAPALPARSRISVWRRGRGHSARCQPTRWLSASPAAFSRWSDRSVRGHRAAPGNTWHASWRRWVHVVVQQHPVHRPRPRPGVCPHGRRRPGAVDLERHSRDPTFQESQMSQDIQDQDQVSHQAQMQAPF